jgi:DNA repair exonuclease SbcCD ATPase subunit
MDNQIQLYHDATAFWLEKDWKTPREKQLDKQVAQLRQEIAQLRQENSTLKARNKSLGEELESLNVFKDIPCRYCGTPMTNWTRSEVLKAFENWHHSRCG